MQICIYINYVSENEKIEKEKESERERDISLISFDLIIRAADLFQIFN